MDIIREWSYENVRLILWYDRWSGNRDYLGYKLTSNGKIIFEGRDFSPSPMYTHDGNESVFSLLAFLTCQLGDTDDEYFESYTDGQLEWVDSEIAEEIRYLVYDFENEED